jgi:U3 small nucleolar ribonucleoprotein component
MSTLTTFSTLDSRKRLNLASIATRDSYRVTREENGTIILEPAVVLSEDELAALQDANLRATVAQARTESRRPLRRLNG